MLELWFRDVASGRTGPAGGVLAVVLLASTSSTAYVSLGAYGLYAFLRHAFAPWGLAARKQLMFAAALLGAGVLILSLIVLVPSLAAYLWKLINLMTVDKVESASGLQRAFWARQGVGAFVASWGLGIGAGSFRSSSLITSIIGSMGIIGILSFLAHLLRSARLFSRETYSLRLPDRNGSAAATTAFVMLAPASVAAPSPDPGLLWAAMCGIALALHPAGRRT
jgi:hypothetical protein